MSEQKNPIAVFRDAGARKFFDGQRVEEFMREVRRGDEDALRKRIAELEAQNEKLKAAINGACSGCWAKDAPDAAQCRLCGLKNAMKANKP